MPVALIALILMMVVPVPPLLLDIFFTLNIVLGLAILMASLCLTHIVPALICISTRFNRFISRFHLCERVRWNIL